MSVFFFLQHFKANAKARMLQGVEDVGNLTDAKKEAFSKALL